MLLDRSLEVRVAKKRVEPAIDLKRHARKCSICKDPRRKEIEESFVGWTSVAGICREYGIDDRRKVDSHCHAFGLFAKRQRNVRAVLERLMERSGDVEVTAPAIVAAVQAYAKINAQGHWVDRTEVVDLNALFERMTAEEAQAYTLDGTLPSWFEQITGPVAPAEGITVDG